MGTTRQAKSEQGPFAAPAPLPFVVSAGSAAALRDRARRLAAHLQDHDGLRAEDVGYSLATARAELAHRAVVIGDGTEGLLEGLLGLAEAAPVAQVIGGVVDANGGRAPDRKS